MKNLTFLVLFTLKSFCLFGQFNFSVGMGPMLNFGTIDNRFQEKNIPTVSPFAGGEVSYSKTNLKYNLGIQWNQTMRNLKPNYSSTAESSKNRITYIMINPSIEYKAKKTIGLRLGGYGAIKTNYEFFKEDSGGWQKPSLGISVFKKYDFGLSGGIGFYLNESISINLQYLHGIKDVYEFKHNGNDNSIISEWIMKNRSLQLSGAYIFD